MEAHLGKQHGWPWVALPYLVLSYGAIVLQFIVRRIGVDLTPEAAVIRGRRRQTVLWRHVQSVVSRVSSNGSSAVLLVFEDGGSVTLPFPKTLWRKGDAPYQRDLERIDQWWLAHRGEAWCPVSKAV